MSKQWNPIRIVGLEVDRTTQSPTASGLRLLYLRLSESPTGVWTQIFDAERAFPRHSMWRHARVSGMFIEIDCVPDELERYHLADLKQDVANANTKYEEWMKQEAARIAQERAHQASERKRITDLAGRLKFD